MIMITSTNYSAKTKAELKEMNPILLIERWIEIRNAIEDLGDKLETIDEEQEKARKIYKKADKGLAVARRAANDYQKMLKRNKSVQISEEKAAEQQAILAQKISDQALADRVLRDAIDILKSKNEWRILITNRGNEMMSEIPTINRLIMKFKAELDEGRGITPENVEAMAIYLKKKEATYQAMLDADS